MIGGILAIIGEVLLAKAVVVAVVKPAVIACRRLID
jgi:hypothetical protein